ncbi:MAG: cytochrome c, partial [Acidobacteriota bacterium]|nr:cytochrome c [Acidobacteriota bacterium]
MNYFLTDKVFPIAVLISAMVLIPFRSAHAQATGNAENGKKVFEKLGCFRCHGSAGEGMPQKEKEASPPQIAGTHLALKDFVKYVRAPKGQMPPFSPAQASDAELSDVYAFLQSVSSQPGLQHKVELSSSANAQNGQQLFTTYG